MAVLCCYTKPHPATLAALQAYAPDVIMADVSDSPYAYWEEITTGWGGADLVLVEQDIEIHGDVLPRFADCPRLWCVNPYQIHDKATLLDFGLGCARFRAEAQQAVSPDAIQAYPGECPVCHGKPGCWQHLDCKIAWAMNAAGIVQCVHWPGVTHHNDQVLRASPANRMRWHRISPDRRDDD